MMAGERRKEFVILWKIKNFSMCPKKNGEELTSSMVKAESLGGSEWFLSLGPRGDSKKSNTFLSCFLCRNQNDEHDAIYFEIEIIAYDGEVIINKRFDYIFDNDHSDQGETEFLALDQLKKKTENLKKDVLTIRCHMVDVRCVPKLSNIMKQPSREILIQTVVGIDCCCMKWYVQYSDSSYWERNKEIYFNETSQLEMTITAPSDNIEIAIRRIDNDSSQSQCISCKITLMNVKGMEVDSKKAAYFFESNQDSCKFPPLLSRKDLEAGINNLMQNNIFRLECELYVSNGDILCTVESITYDVPPINNTISLEESFLALQEDFSSMLLSRKNCDIKLRIGNFILPVHKCILCARSPVFSAMFDQNMLENQTGIVDIDDTDAKTLNSLLEFVYTGLVTEMNSDIAMKLMIAADKYQISTLTEKCSLFLTSKLSVENVCDIYTLADMVNHKCLKSSALRYIVKNSKRVLKSNFWSDWMGENVKLANEVLCELAFD